MNLLMGVIAGAATGWIAYGMVKASRERGLRPTLFFGSLGGAIGAFITPMVTTSAVDGPASIALLVLALTGAAVTLYVSNFIANRLGV